MCIVDCGALVIGLMFAMGQKQTSRSEIAMPPTPESRNCRPTVGLSAKTGQRALQ
jgi:hypothetical protein